MDFEVVRFYDFIKPVAIIKNMKTMLAIKAHLARTSKEVMEATSPSVLQ